MKRRLFTILSALSLVLCIATAAIWVRSYWTRDGWSMTAHEPEFRYTLPDGYWVLGDTSYLLESHEGRLAVGMQRSRAGQFPIDSMGLLRLPDDGCTAWEARLLGFRVSTEHIGPVLTAYSVWVPYWFPNALVIVLWLPYGLRRVRSFRERRKVMGLCLTCGYDLRASPERCPECGTAVPPSPATSPASQAGPSLSNPA